MTERAYTRDVVVLVKDLTYPCRVTAAMSAAGWPGGQGVVWAPTGSDEFLLDFSDGLPAAFLLWGSNEDSDQFVAYTGSQPRYGYAVACVGTWIIATRTFEQYTLQSRLVPPLVENVYIPGTHVKFSLRGLCTSQDEWTISGDPRAPNDNVVGSVIQAPNPSNNNYLMLQTFI
jgi:hypothetical protein